MLAAVRTEPDAAPHAPDSLNRPTIVAPLELETPPTDLASPFLEPRVLVAADPRMQEEMGAPKRSPVEAQAQGPADISAAPSVTAQDFDSAANTTKPLARQVAGAVETDAVGTDAVRTAGMSVAFDEPSPELEPGSAAEAALEAALEPGLEPAPELGPVAALGSAPEQRHGQDTLKEPELEHELQSEQELDTKTETKTETETQPPDTGTEYTAPSALCRAQYFPCALTALHCQAPTFE